MRSGSRVGHVKLKNDLSSENEFYVQWNSDKKIRLSRAKKPQVHLIHESLERETLASVTRKLTGTTPLSSE